MDITVKQEPCEDSPSSPECERPRNNCMDVEVPRDDRFLYCEDCNKEYEGDCSVHGPLLMVADTQEAPGSADRAWKTLPVGLEIEESGIPGAGLGVWASQDFDPRTCFGPYEGEVVIDEVTAHGSGYSWQIHADGQPSHFIDGQNCNTVNWMRYVNCARTEEEQNLTAFQYNGHIYYKVYKKICVGSELLVWYGHKYARNLGIERQLKLEEGLTKDTYPCDRCDKGFSSVMFLWKHLMKMHGGKLTAQLRFIVNTQGVNIHDFIGVIERQLLRKKPRKCRRCGKEFNAKRQLREHRCLRKVKPFPCKECGETFMQMSDRDKHMNVHGTWTLKCSVCRKLFPTSSALKQHKKIQHVEGKPFSCEERGKSFKRSQQRKAHMMSHSEIKPFPCFLCGKECKGSDSLKKHLVTHE